MNLLGVIFLNLKLFLNFGGVSGKASEVDELLVSELANVLGELVG